MRYTVIYHGCKNDTFQLIFSLLLLKTLSAGKRQRQPTIYVLQ